MLKSSSSAVRTSKDDRDTRLSKSLSWILRHGAIKMGFSIDQGGFLDVADILMFDNFRGFTVDDVKRVVSADLKQRYTLRQGPSPDSRLLIRANQGHSIQVSDLELTELTDTSSVACVVHGTYSRKLPTIMKQGLSRMNRNHVHFASSDPESDEVISGARRDCDVFIYVDLERALHDGLRFYRSSNGVILCAGNSRGVVPPEYFLRVVHRK